MQEIQPELCSYLVNGTLFILVPHISGTNTSQHPEFNPTFPKHQNASANTAACDWTVQHIWLASFCPETTNMPNLFLGRSLSTQQAAPNITP
jgi:hypothetical protein